MDWSLITASPLFGVLLTVGTLLAYTLLFARFKTPLLNPFLFAMFTIIGLLLLFKIPYEHYEKGASILSFFMGPSIVALAIPLYRQLDKLKRHALPILAGVLVGVVVSMASGILLARLFALGRELAVSFAPKGVTSAIAYSLSQDFGGLGTISVTLVIIAGLSGYMMGARAMALIGIKNPVARGIGLGTSAHAMGTKKALEMGEEEGAMASLAIGLAGVLTSLLMPLFTSLLI